MIVYTLERYDPHGNDGRGDTEPIDPDEVWLRRETPDRIAAYENTRQLERANESLRRSVDEQNRGIREHNALVAAGLRAGEPRTLKVYAPRTELPKFSPRTEVLEIDVRED